LGTSDAVQMAAVEALVGDQTSVAELRAIYRERVAVLCDALVKAGFEVIRPRATFYCLVANPPGYSSLEFAARLLSEAQVGATPASGFGAGGEGFVRLTVCADQSRLAEAGRRMAALKL